ncbi:MAG: hypothetical protein ACT4P1_13115 [Sporichthyaceae bacterium]
MTADKTLSPAAITGKIVDKAPPISPMAVVTEIVQLGREWIRVHEEESTKREAIRAHADVRIAEIHERRDLFLSYLDRSFDERERVFDNLFRQLDQAMSGNPEAVPTILASISTMAHKSPFADLHDPVALRQKLDDPNAEWTV